MSLATVTFVMEIFLNGKRKWRTALSPLHRNNQDAREAVLQHQEQHDGLNPALWDTLSHRSSQHDARRSQLVQTPHQHKTVGFEGGEEEWTGTELPGCPHHDHL